VIAPAGCGDSPPPALPDGRPVWLYDAPPPDAPRPIDAPPPDACPYSICDYFCVDLTSDPEHCGDCDKSCTRAAACVESDCSCPSDFIPASVADGDPPPSFNVDGLPVVSLRATFTGNDDLPHQLRMTWDADTVATGVDYDLAVVETPTVRISYNRSFEGPRGTFVPTAGTLQLSRVCNDGVAGTLTSASFIETASGPSGGESLEDGCTFDVASLSFDFGTDCPPE